MQPLLTGARKTIVSKSNILVARHNALYCFVVVYVILHSWLNILID